MIPELCPTDWNHRDKRSSAFPFAFHEKKEKREDSEKKKRKEARRGEIKAWRPKEIGGLGMEICLNSEDLSVVLYGGWG